MLFKYIISLSILFTAVAIEVCQLDDNLDYQTPAFLKLKHKSIPMPRPAPGKPLIVKISAEIMTVTVNEDEEQFETTFFFRQEWIDPRLAFESEDKQEYRVIKDSASIWTPDLFFVKNFINQTDRNGNNTFYIKHFPDGRVLTAERKTVKSSCSVNLSMYPFDTHTCELQIESFGYTTDDIIVEWNDSKDESAVTANVLNHDYVTSIQSGLAITNFRGVEYSSPRIVFRLSRTPTAIILRVILPIFTIALCSWTSYFFTREVIGLRVTLCISPILTYILQINFCAAFFLSPMYLTSLDVWAVTSVVALSISGVESIYIVFWKPSRENGHPEGESPKFKTRVLLALFVTCLDVLSIASVYLSRLL